MPLSEQNLFDQEERYSIYSAARQLTINSKSDKSMKLIMVRKLLGHILVVQKFQTLMWL